MKKKFKAKRHIKKIYIPYLIILFIVLISLILLTYISKLKVKNDIVSLLRNSNIYEIDLNKEKKRLVTLITGIDISTPVSILEVASNYEKEDTMVFALNKNEKEVSQEPLVYIYNTHQTEEYVANDIVLTPTVLTGAYYLRDLLEQNGIKTIVEEENISKILEDNNWNYASSYKASRINLEKIKNEYPSIKMFIDFHRDSVNRNISTVTIDEKNYAKVLFVIGKEHDNYLSNLDFTNKFNDIIKSNYPTLTKGVLQKEGIGVNGIYNQDIGTNVILMEVGGCENTIEEVTNTLEIIAPLIKEYINEY